MNSFPWIVHRGSVDFKRQGLIHNVSIIIILHSTLHFCKVCKFLNKRFQIFDMIWRQYFNQPREVKNEEAALHTILLSPTKESYCASKWFSFLARQTISFCMYCFFTNLYHLWVCVIVQQINGKSYVHCSCQTLWRYNNLPSMHDHQNGGHSDNIYSGQKETRFPF